MEVQSSHSSDSRIQIGPKKKIAFVCSGGAVKAGAFHLGVALALQEQGFRFYGGLVPPSGEIPTPGPMEISTYVGSSAGSFIVTCLAAGYSIDNIFHSFLGKKPTHIDPLDKSPKILPRFTYQQLFRLGGNFGREQLGSLRSLLQAFSNLKEGDWESIIQFKWLRATGLFSTVGLEEYFREEVLLSNRFQDYMADLFIVATQLNHSRKVVFGKTSHHPPPHDLTCQYENSTGISDAVASSTALPVIYSPHGIKNQKGQTIYYIDGEVRDTLSTHVGIDSGADLVISSYTHQPYHFPTEEGSLTSFGLPAIIVQSIYLLVEQKINNHIHNKKIQRDAINQVSKYCKEQGVSNEHRNKIIQILESTLHHRRDVDTIYIHPNPADRQMFFGEHFSLSPKKMSEIVKSGFRAAIDILRKYDFADRQKKPAIGVSDTPSGSPSASGSS